MQTFLLLSQKYLYQVTRGIVLIIKANEMHYFSNYFGKQLYMFRTDSLPIMSLNTIFTAIFICHTSYVECLLSYSYVDCLLEDSRHN
jgi:hypothetical protein